MGLSMICGRMRRYSTIPHRHIRRHPSMTPEIRYPLSFPRNHHPREWDAGAQLSCIQVLVMSVLGWQAGSALGRCTATSARRGAALSGVAVSRGGQAAFGSGLIPVGGGERRGMCTQGPVKRHNWPSVINEYGKKYSWLLKALGGMSEDARLARSASLLYVSAREQAARKEFSKLGLQEDFSTRFYLECLHVWILLVRLRQEGSKTTELRQDLFDRFWEDVTRQIHQLGVKPIALSARVRELQNAFYGSALAYDHSLGTEDAILASALYRNIYGHEAKASHLMLLTNYVRREVHQLNGMELDKFLDGNWNFGSPLEL